MEMFPYKDYPNLGFKLIQFLAGPETAIIDVFFRELKKMNDGKYTDNILVVLSTALIYSINKCTIIFFT